MPVVALVNLYDQKNAIKGKFSSWHIPKLKINITYYVSVTSYVLRKDPVTHISQLNKVIASNQRKANLNYVFWNL